MKCSQLRIVIAGLLLFFPAYCGVAENQEPDGRNNKMLIVKDGELLVSLGAKPSPAETRVKELLAERIKERTGLSLTESADEAKFRLVVGKVASSDNIKAFSATRKGISTLGDDGYCIAVDPKKTEFYVIGQSDSGVVAGIGRLMREMQYGQGQLEVPALQICEAPQMPNRGMYLWARKHYFNSPDQVDRYIEELALWGCNGISFWFEMGMFNSFESTEKLDKNAGYHNHKNTLPASDYLNMYRRFYKTARRMGMKTGLLMVVNDAYRTSPKEMRIKPIIGSPNCFLCPSKPGAVEKMLAWQEEVFKALAPIDIYNIFPADPGGCSCKECVPWPTGGFWKVAKPLGDRIHAISPKTEIWVDTWHLNHPTFGGKDWKNLVDSLDWSKERPEWFAGFEVAIAPHHKYAGMGSEERDYYNKAKQPLTVFPDISMWGNHRGMLVNKNYWKSLQTELNSYDPELMKGGWPYAERWNTDIANAVFLSWFWNSKKPVETVLDEYAALYFGPEAKSGRALLELLDDSNKDPDRKQKIQETLAKLEASVPEWVKRDWRWGEIVASSSRFGVSPRKRRAPAKPRDPTTVASSEFSADYHAGYAHDGVLSSQDGENFWASANREDVDAWWQKNLGKKTAIEKVEVQFRGIRGSYQFVPKTITFQVSDDGITWTTVLSKATNVPANKSPYDSTMHTYELNAEGQYVRLLFEEGTDDNVGGLKLVELVEVKVIAVENNERASITTTAEHRSALPKALIIGDSISIGYTKPLTKILKGKVVVVHNRGNAGTSKQGLANLNGYLGKTKWDIIHFNHGMHDLRYLDDATGKDTTLEGKGHIKVPIEAYEKNMEAIVLRLKKTGAKLIFATTTPYPAGMSRPLSKYRQSKKYNEVALKIMNKHNVAVDDLYAFVAPRLEKLQIPGDIHFNQEGSNAMAEEVAKHILKVIKITNE